MFYIDSNTFSITLFLFTTLNEFVITEWFSLNSSSNSIFEILVIKDFLVDLICLRVSFMALKMLKFSSSGLIMSVYC